MRYLCSAALRNAMLSLVPFSRNIRMRYILLHTLAILTIVFVVITTSVLAEESNVDLPSLGESQIAQWQQVDAKMARKNYRTMVRHNRRIITRFTRNYVEQQFISMGMSDQSVRLTSAAVGFLVEGGGKISLNSSDTLALEVRDLAKGDRAMLFNFKLGW